MRVTGLGRGLSDGLARWRAPRAVYDPGKVIADLAAAVALGGDCLADIVVSREQPGLAGPVASDPAVSRLFAVLAADGPRALNAIRSARAAARERAWSLVGDAAPGADGGLVTVDLDATIVIAHSEKDQAAPTWKNDVRVPPDDRLGRPRPGGSEEPLAVVLRPSGAGSNTTADHVEATRMALGQLPRHLRRRVLIPGRLGWRHARVPGLADRPVTVAALLRRLHHHPGHPGRIGKVPADAWAPAYDGNGQVRDGAWVADIIGLPDLSSWPAGMRVIIRKERPHPGRSCGSPTSTGTGSPASHRREEGPGRRPGTPAPPPGPVRGPHPVRQ